MARSLLLLRFVIATALTIALPAKSWGQDARTITDRAMENLHPSSDTSFEMLVFECPHGKGSCAASDSENRTELRVYIADYKKNQSAPPKTVIHFLSPKKVAGQLILYEINRIWMYFPNTRSAVRIPPEQNLLGDVDVGALLNVDYRFNHEMTLVDQDDQSFHMEYVGIDGSRTLMSISKKHFVPVSAEYFAPSGRRIRSATFSDIGSIGGRTAPRRINFVSHLNNRNRGGLTSLVLVSESHKRLPKILLNPSQLPTFHKRVK